MLEQVLSKIEPPFSAIKPCVSLKKFFEIADEDTKIELINGDLIMHSPASFKHEDVFAFLFRVMGTFVSHHNLGKVLGSRFPVKLSKKDVLEPDIIFISNEKIRLIRERYFDGAPDLVIEILSESTKRYDLGEKLEKYFEYGVKEYWVVRCESTSVPDKKWVRIYTSKSEFNEFKRGRIKSSVMRFWIDASWLWRVKKPSEKDCLDKILE